MPVRCECKTCGKVFFKPPFTVKDGRGRFCSRVCLYKNTSIRLKGKPTGRQLFGSAGPNWRGGIPQKECPWCKKSFTGKVRSQVTCSRRCGLLLGQSKRTGDNNGARKKNPPKQKVCRSCGRLFSRNNGEVQKRGSGVCPGGGKYYCSNSCSQKKLWQSVRQMRINQELKSRGFDTELEKSWPWLVSPFSKNKLRVDIFLEKFSLAIEYDGRQHYQQAFAKGTEALEKIQKKDQHKNSTLNSRGFSVLRIRHYPVNMRQLEEFILLLHKETHSGRPLTVVVKSNDELFQWLKKIRSYHCHKTSLPP